MSHDAHELCVFFSDATLEEKTAALLEICSQKPDFLLDVIREMNTPSWQKECLDILGDGTASGVYIPAIKHCRSVTGWGLKEAKDGVDELMTANGISR